MSTLASTAETLGITHLVPLSETLLTSGQPTEAQFRGLAHAGLAKVIRLNLDDPSYALPGQRELMHELGLGYRHIPVDFTAPSREDLAAFCEVFEAWQGEPLLVHCTKNYRVAAFMALHRVLRQGWQREAAEEELHTIWEPDEIWQAFIAAHIRTRPASEAL